MASRPIFDDIDYSSFEAGDSSKRRYIDDPFAASTRAKKSKPRKIPLRTSEWTNHMVRVKDGEKGRIVPITFDERKYLIRPYDTECREVLLMTSRQTEKSTTLGNKLIALCGMNWYQNVLFVTPSATQTKVFSSARIDDIVDISPMVKALQHKSLTWNILEKEFLTQSKIYLRYAFLNADRIRGISVSSIFYDEVQDLLKDVIPVIRESASRYRNALHVYSGTPKTFDNSIESIWGKQSTMSEWVVPCEHHTPWHWIVLGPKNIGKRGPICERCGHTINPEHPSSQWVAMNPGATVEGYRICRLMVPWYFKPDFEDQDPYKAWNSILHAMETYPTAQFMNEVMALSYDSGLKPLSRAEVARACDETDTYMMDEEQVAALATSHQLYGGIDWGTGENAYTVLVVGGYVRGDTSFQILYAKRFDGLLTDPEPQMREIMRLINRFRLKYVGCDYGMGFVQNKKLTSVYSAKKIFQFQYAARAPRKIVYKAALNRSLVFRTAVMADIFSAIKTMKIRLPAWEPFKVPYAEDLLSIHAEYSDTLRMIKYDKPRSIPDDTFHAILYCMIVSFFDHRRPDIIAPIQEVSTEEAAARVREEIAIEEIEMHVANDWAPMGGGVY
jgi:hypothetical protein